MLNMVKVSLSCLNNGKREVSSLKSQLNPENIWQSTALLRASILDVVNVPNGLASLYISKTILIITNKKKE